MSRLARSATIVEDLVEYDGPQLSLLRSNRQHHVLATAIRYSGMKAPFFCCEITEKTYEVYFNQKTDLHYAFSRALGHQYYLYDLVEAESDHDGKVNLIPVPAADAENEAYWPRVGFFARSHTAAFDIYIAVAQLRRYKIDGKWSASDFSRFHAKMADLYALFSSFRRMNGTNKDEERDRIKEIIHQKMWQRGGSYVGFYDEMESRNRTLGIAPLDIARINYASPGEISLKGDGLALADIGDVVDVFQEKQKELENRYKGLYGTLKRERLLSARPEAAFSTVGVDKFVLTIATEFANELGIENVQDLVLACQNNTLVFAKVLMSVYRRASELYKFYDQGRVQKLP